MGSVQSNTPKISLKDAILKIVNEKQGVREVELALGVMNLIPPGNIDMSDFQVILDKLIKNKEIIRLNYIPAGIKHEKYMYFPQGTVICVNQDK